MEPKGVEPSGLSPRLRGNRVLAKSVRHYIRSIPAPAGEPCFRRPPAAAGPVYPRACGGTTMPCHRLNSSKGLSPRLRGNPTARACPVRLPGSIPAPAGEPRRACLTTPQTPVYPRACGDNRQYGSYLGASVGGPPRVRGRHPAEVYMAGLRGIWGISACAGRQLLGGLRIDLVRSRVDLRVCGDNFLWSGRAASAL